MIYVTGDTHGDYDIEKLSNKNLRKRGIKIRPEDYMVILGDFGLPFLDKELEERKGAYHYWIKWLANKPYTILWVDGNHDNFNFWDAQPVTEKFGGKVQVHPHATNVIHLMRGEVYTLEGKTIFAFGGAESHDKEYRTENYNWWAREVASDEEISRALLNLEKVNNKVDYIFTHAPAARLFHIFDGAYSDGKTETFLNKVMDSVDYSTWFFGHMHKDGLLHQSSGRKCVSLYKAVVQADKVEL